MNDNNECDKEERGFDDNGDKGVDDDARGSVVHRKTNYVTDNGNDSVDNKIQGGIGNNTFGDNNNNIVDDKENCRYILQINDINANNTSNENDLDNNSSNKICK